MFLALWIAVAGLALGHGDLHEHMERVNREIATSPQNGNLYLQRAALHAAHEELKAAAADYARAETLHADPLAVWLGRGKVELASGRWADAKATLSRLLAREPRHVDALVTRARARIELADIDGAVADFTAAIGASTRPEPEYFLERAAALAGAHPPRWQSAIQGLDDGLKQLGSGVVTLLLAAIDLESRAGRVDDALSRIDRALATTPRKETWLLRRGDLLVLAGRPAEARHDYEAAIAATAALPARLRKAGSIADLEIHAREALGKLPAAPTEVGATRLPGAE